MCKWGTSTPVRVKVAAHLSSTGKEKWREFGIDACIATIVKALQEGGIDMLGSCCGHGKAPGRIDLADGRIMLIAQNDQDAQNMAQAAMAAKFQGSGGTDAGPSTAKR